MCSIILGFSSLTGADINIYVEVGIGVVLFIKRVVNLLRSSTENQICGLFWFDLNHQKSYLVISILNIKMASIDY